MTRKTKKAILISISIIAITGMAAGYFIYNKKHADVKNSNGIEVAAVDLYNLYGSDSLLARKKYTDKILEVSGEVTEISINTQQHQVVLLKTNTTMASVNCTLDEVIENVKPNDKVKIKGICSGLGQGDPELGIMGDVYLIRCVVAK